MNRKVGMSNRALTLDVRAAKLRRALKADKLPVLMRVDRDGHVSAVFPTIPSTNDPNDFTAYDTQSQHGGASMGWFNDTENATPEQYKNTLTDVERVYHDYDIEVVDEITPAMDRERRAELDRMNGKSQYMTANALSAKSAFKSIVRQKLAAKGLAVETGDAAAFSKYLNTNRRNGRHTVKRGDGFLTRAWYNEWLPKILATDNPLQEALNDLVDYRDIAHEDGFSRSTDEQTKFLYDKLQEACEFIGKGKQSLWAIANMNAQDFAGDSPNKSSIRMGRLPDFNKMTQALKRRVKATKSGQLTDLKVGHIVPKNAGLIVHFLKEAGSDATYDISPHAILVPMTLLPNLIDLGEEGNEAADELTQIYEQADKAGYEWLWFEE